MGYDMSGIDFYIFSRKALLYNGTYYRPDVHDVFYPAGYTYLDGTTGRPEFINPSVTCPEYQIKNWKNIGPAGAGYICAINVQYHVHAKG
jgi:hypothetical protein